MKTLIGYEIKKILMKKSTIVAFLLLFAIQCVIAIAGSLGSTYVNDVFVETHMERNRIDRENGIVLSGRSIDDELLSEARAAYQKIEGVESYLLSEVYQTEVRRYSDLHNRIRMWGLGSVASDSLTEEALYQQRREMREAMWTSYELSKEELQYWTEKEAGLQLPLTYEYATAYEYLLNMSGGYMTCMLLTFFIAISMVNVFTEEHSRKTDQLILCTRYGKGKLYLAKIFSGSIVVFAANLLFLVVSLAGRFFSFGAEGFDAAIQLVVGFEYSYALSVGEALLIVIGLLLLSSVMTTIFAMILAELLRNSLGAMAILIGGLFAARLLVIPVSWNLLSQLWSYIPINLLKIDLGFTDLRLVSIFGIQLTTWQFAPILYLLLIGMLVLVGGKLWKSYQVKGR